MKKRKIAGWALLVLLIAGFAWPQHIVMPVAGADSKSYHPQSFWYYPWGKSVVHKGVDIFAKEGVDVLSATPGLVVYSGTLGIGGQVVIVLGPKWRLHYYAHLREINTGLLRPVGAQKKIGTVGTTGNAVGKAPHLHYSIFTLLPYPWRIDASRQGWLKMFFLNPIDYLKGEG